MTFEEIADIVRYNVPKTDIVTRTTISSFALNSDLPFSYDQIVNLGMAYQSCYKSVVKNVTSKSQKPCNSTLWVNSLDDLDFMFDTIIKQLGPKYFSKFSQFEIKKHVFTMSPNQICKTIYPKLF